METMVFTVRGRRFEVWAAGGPGWGMVWYREEGGLAYLGSIDAAVRYANRMAWIYELAGL